MNILRSRPVVSTFLTLALCSLGVAQSRSPVAPTPEAFQATLKEAYNKFKGETTGKNADYIPYLAQVDSKLYGIAVVTTDGKIYKYGDVGYAFSIQSISKVFTLALAMEEMGAKAVFDKVGSEPTGRPFNSVLAVVDMPTHAGNPYVNAGAIATTSLIRGANPAARWNKILDYYGKAAGSRLTLIDAVYESEAATNAVDHGLLKLDSALKQEGFEAYDTLRKERLASQETGTLTLRLRLYREAPGTVCALSVEVEDSGPGFDWRAWEQVRAADDHQASGRGLLIIRSVASEMSFNESGNCLRFTLSCG